MNLLFFIFPIAFYLFVYPALLTSSFPSLSLCFSFSVSPLSDPLFPLSLFFCFSFYLISSLFSLFPLSLFLLVFLSYLQFILSFPLSSLSSSPFLSLYFGTIDFFSFNSTVFSSCSFAFTLPSI